MTTSNTFADRLQVTISADYRQGDSIVWDSKGGQVEKNGYDASIGNKQVGNDPWRINHYR